MRGKHGPVHISLFGRNTLGDAFHKACVQAGVPATPDYNGAQYEGVGYLQSNTKRGLRFGGREAYLRPARGRPNLRVRTGARADRIRVEKGRAVGVEYRVGGERQFARASREVIVSAGAVQSPQLLELSGIGDKERLAEFGIASVAHLPGVGENCRDHLHTRVSFECAPAHHPERHPRQSLAQGLDGPALPGAAATARWRPARRPCTRWPRPIPSLDRPDVKIQMHNLSAEDPRHPTELVLDKFPGFGIGTFALRPESTGSVHIRSADPDEPPAIEANYLTDARDRKTSIAALRLARRIAEQPALAKLIVREVRPGPEAQSDAALLEHIAKLGATSYHPIGTCKMGSDAHGGGGPRAARAWRQGPARRRRLHHADHGLLQHERALVPDRRALRRFPAARCRR